VIQAVEDTSTYLDRGEVERQENLELFWSDTAGLEVGMGKEAEDQLPRPGAIFKDIREGTTS
jgi:hypothetical protein